MNKNKIPIELALDVARRSICRVKMGAVILDSKGRIISWGWNHHLSTDGPGNHAETHAIKRANPKRLPFSTIYTAGIRPKKHNFVYARPCSSCQQIIKAVGIEKMVWMDKEGKMRSEFV